MSDYSNTHWMKDQLQDENFHCAPEKKGLYDPVNGCVHGREFTKPEVFFNTPLGFPVHVPDMWKVEKFTILNTIDALEAGLENTRTVLTEHDQNLGRTTAKNKVWANALEGQIRLIEDCLKKLKEVDVCNSTHYA